MRLFSCTAFFLLFPFCFLGEVFAQDFQDPAAPLSLADAVERTLNQNFDIQIEKKRLEQVALDNTLGETGIFPTVVLEMQQGNVITNIDNPASFLAGDILNNNFQPALSVNWTLFGGFRVKINRARLAALEAESAGNVAIVVENAVQNVIKAYYQTTLEWERLEVQKKVLNFSRDRYAYVEVKRELGTGVSSDVLLEETNFLSDSTAFINQKLLYENTLRNLNQLMGENDPNANYALTDSLEAVPQAYDIDELQTAMLISNANLYRQYLTQRVLAENVRLAEANQMPTVDLSLRASQNRNRQDLSNATLINGGTFEDPVVTAITTVYSGTFNFRFTAFDGGRLKRAITRAKLGQEVAQLQLEGLQQSLTRDLHNLLATYNAQRQVLEVAKRSQEVALRNMEISQERFRVGTINSFDLRIVQNNYLNAATAALQATYNLLATETDLLRLTGKILQEN